jgi:hypothetical protein
VPRSPAAPSNAVAALTAARDAAAAAASAARDAVAALAAARGAATSAAEARPQAADSSENALRSGDFGAAAGKEGARTSLRTSLLAAPDLQPPPQTLPKVLPLAPSQDSPPSVASAPAPSSALPPEVDETSAAPATLFGDAAAKPALALRPASPALPVPTAIAAVSAAPEPPSAAAGAIAAPMPLVAAPARKRRSSPSRLVITVSAADALLGFELGASSVSHVSPGGAAAAGGLRSGDVLVDIAGLSVDGLSGAEAAMLLVAKVRPMTLTFLRPGSGIAGGGGNGGGGGDGDSGGGDDAISGSRADGHAGVGESDSRDRDGGDESAEEVKDGGIIVGGEGGNDNIIAAGGSNDKEEGDSSDGNDGTHAMAEAALAWESLL